MFTPVAFLPPCTRVVNRGLGATNLGTSPSSSVPKYRVSSPLRTKMSMAPHRREDVERSFRSRQAIRIAKLPVIIFAALLSACVVSPVVAAPRAIQAPAAAIAPAPNGFRGAAGPSHGSSLAISVREAAPGDMSVKGTVARNSETAHESLGERVAGALKRSGISDELVVLFVSALPVVELRAGVPIGIALLGLPPLKVFILACIGNLLPVLLLTPLLELTMRVAPLQRLLAPVLSRARSKAASIANANSRATALAVFVGIPAPGTGAFTGCLVAFVLGMPAVEAITSIFAGIVMAAGIMTILSIAGRLGAALACAVLLGFGVSSLVASRTSAGSVDTSPPGAMGGYSQGEQTDR